jgi:hypothetical protein
LPDSLIRNIFQTKAADLNGDGDLDLIAVNFTILGPGYVAVYLGNGDGTFRPVNLLPVTSVPGAIDSVAVADFNGDKKLDILACDYGEIYANGIFDARPSTLLFYAGNGDGTFQAPVPTTTWGTAYVGIAANADFTGTGRQDLLITSLPTAIPNASSDGLDAMVLGNGDGTFQGPQSVIWIPNVESGGAL